VTNLKKKMSIEIEDAKEVLEVFSSLDDKTKELALATLTGMRLVSEVKQTKKAI